MRRTSLRGLRFVIEPNLLGTNGWLALREDLAREDLARDDHAREDLARRFAGVQVWFSDLDDFDTVSPAKIIAMNAVGTGHLRPAYLRWVLKTIGLFRRYGRKRGESMSWKLYYDSFLKRSAEEDWLKDEAFAFIDRILAPESIPALLYPGVREFYSRLNAEVYLVTRNLERIAYRYSKVLPYSAYYHEAKDKASIVEAIVKSRPEVTRYGSGGDSSEDEEVAELLGAYYRRGLIERPVCLFRAESPSALSGSFNVFVGKNRSGLARVLSLTGSSS
jgi:hypothetical protein